MYPHISDKDLFKFNTELEKLYAYRRTACNETSRKYFTTHINLAREMLASLCMSNSDLVTAIKSKI